ncbi:MAG: hypothetical protein ACI33N_07620 [Desulfovibrionaceae bacterium]|nr:hypothetical protein [Desulfovibrionaceae bacterium]
MEHLLQKMARQLDALDEASLMSLWGQYAARVSRFEPTKRWEEAALVFSLIQAKRWKNQLFNHHWAQQARPAAAEAPHSGFTLDRPESSPAPQQRCKILRFRPGKGD